MFRLICMLALLLVIAPSHAGDMGRELAKARSVFLQGVDGDKRAVRDATTRFRTLSVRHPDDPVFLAYFGASMTLQGRDASNDLDKMRLTKDGLKKIDRALKLLSAGHDNNSSEELETMLVAADSFIHIPAFFNRYDRGKRLLGRILEHPDFARMAPGFKAAAYLAAALVARGEGDEDKYRRYLDLTIKTDPEGRDGRMAGKLKDEKWLF